MILGYIILGIFLLFFGWCLSIWWALNKWLVIGAIIIVYLVIMGDVYSVFK